MLRFGGAADQARASALAAANLRTLANLRFNSDKCEEFTRANCVLAGLFDALRDLARFKLIH